MDGFDLDVDDGNLENLDLDLDLDLDSPPQ